MVAVPDASLPVPLYRQVFGILRQRIVDSAYAPGEQLHTEDQLAEEFGVSRATIRQSVGELVRQGLVDRKQGKGTFVLPVTKKHLGQRFSGSLADLIVEAKRAGVKNVTIDYKASIPQRIADKLQLADTLATVVRRARTIDGYVFAFTKNYIPPRLGELITVGELKASGLMTLLESKNIRFALARQVIRAELADIEVSSQLTMDIGAPVLFVERLLIDENGQPVQFVQSWYRADLYEFSVTLNLAAASGEGPGYL
jgi:GntR family transcriptional regulator